MEILKAYPHHARDIAYLTNLAAEGLAAYLWSQSAEQGPSALDIGTEAATGF